jgi:predicted enzyme related to lactoylglutathione lyase
MPHTRLRLVAAVAVVAGSACLAAQGRDADRPASLLTAPSMNVFRRFAVDRAKMIEFYGDVLALKPLPALNMPGGGQMTRFQVGTSEIKLTTNLPGRPPPGGAIRDVTGLRVFTFFFPDEAALTARFKSHGYPAPEFRGAGGSARAAMVPDPDGQWVELMVVPGAPNEMFSRIEVGLTVSDVEKSRRFYGEFVGLEELEPGEARGLATKQYRYRHGTTTINVWSFGKGLPANTTSAGIQYVVRDVGSVDERARAWGINITQPLGPFGAGLRTIWLGDPDGITNYFAQITRSQAAAAPASR